MHIVYTYTYVCDTLSMRHQTRRRDIHQVHLIRNTYPDRSALYTVYEMDIP